MGTRDRASFATAASASAWLVMTTENLLATTHRDSLLELELRDRDDANKIVLQLSKKLGSDGTLEEWMKENMAKLLTMQADYVSLPVFPDKPFKAQGGSSKFEPLASAAVARR